MSDEKKIGILDHLRELRKRLLWSVLVVVITTFACFFFIEDIVEILKAPAGDINLVFIEMTEGFTTYLKVSLMAGIVVAMPFLLYQFLMFLIPALTRRERRSVYTILPFITIMFVGGILFGYYFLIPPATGFLLNFGVDIAEPQIRVSNYIDFITRLLVAIGLLFELPILTSFLARMGVISSRWLAERRKMVIIFAFVLAAIITPTPDIFNQSIVAGTIIVLYEISILLARLLQKKRKETNIEVDSEEQ